MRMTQDASSTIALYVCAVAYKFTGKERDSESGNDYFGARYYNSAMGRFMSPDWASDPTAIPYASYINPQSLNLYTYRLNHPLSGVDPDGHCCTYEVLVALSTLAGVIGGTYIAAQVGAGTGTLAEPGAATIAGTVRGGLI